MMSPQEIQRLTYRLINKEKWWDFLSRFISVLRINLFIVDTQGKVILPPEQAKYGGNLLVEKKFGFDLFEEPQKLIPRLRPLGKFFQLTHQFNLFSFAIPIVLPTQQVLGYLFIGPLILNKRMDVDFYKKSAVSLNVDESELIDEIRSVRVVSHVMINSILNLLSELVKDNIRLALKDEKMDHGQQHPVDQALRKAQQMEDEIYSAVHTDELLINLLDVALKLTDTQCGSIMILDQAKKELVIKVSRGIPENIVEKTKQRLGEGIAGIALEEQRSYVLGSQASTGNRIEALLERDDIRHSLVMPLMVKDRPFGVLNLNTKNEECRISENLSNLQYLSRLLSSALES